MSPKSSSTSYICICLLVVLVSINSVVVASEEKNNELIYELFKNNKSMRPMAPYPAERIEAFITGDYKAVFIWLNSSPQSRVTLSPRDSSGKKYGPHISGGIYKFYHHFIYNFQNNKLYMRHTAGTTIEDEWLADCIRNYDFEPVRFSVDIDLKPISFTRNDPINGYWYSCFFPYDKTLILRI